MTILGPHIRLRAIPLRQGNVMLPSLGMRQQNPISGEEKRKTGNLSLS
jgi:hypothetical protein